MLQGVLMIDDCEMPTIKKSNELLIQVKATSLNVIDTKICSGYSRIYRRLLNSGVSKLSQVPIDIRRNIVVMHEHMYLETERTTCNFRERLCRSDSRHWTRRYQLRYWR